MLPQLCRSMISLSTCLVGLTDTMGSREGLDVIVRVPVRIVNDDSVSCGQVDPQASSTRGQQENELLGSGCIEPEGKHINTLTLLEVNLCNDRGEQFFQQAYCMSGFDYIYQIFTISYKKFHTSLMLTYQWPPVEPSR